MITTEYWKEKHKHQIIDEWIQKNFPKNVKLINYEVVFDNSASELDYYQQTEQTVEDLGLALLNWNPKYFTPGYEK